MSGLMKSGYLKSFCSKIRSGFQVACRGMQRLPEILYSVSLSKPLPDKIKGFKSSDYEQLKEICDNLNIDIDSYLEE